MPRIDIAAIEQSNRTGYPAPFDAAVEGRWWRRLAPVGGLTEMGASHVVLGPGAWSSQRHWHDDEDELLVILTGEAVLVEDDIDGNGGANGGPNVRRTVLRPGDVCAWPKGVPNGHHLVNESDADCSYIAISAGDRAGSGAYSDIDMKFSGDGYFHKDGTPYPTQRMR